MRNYMSILCLCLTLTFFCGCNKNNFVSNTAPPTKAPTASPTIEPTPVAPTPTLAPTQPPDSEVVRSAIKTTVNNFYSAMLQYNWETAKTYTVDSTYIPNDYWESNFANDAFADALISENSALEPYIDKFEPFSSVIFKKITDGMTHKITAVKFKDNNYICTVLSTELPTEFTSYIEKALEGYMTDEGMTELSTEFSTQNASESDAMNAIFNSLIKKATESAEKAEFEFETNTHTIYVSFSEGKWLVDTRNSIF